jgi:hypothetical protein
MDYFKTCIKTLEIIKSKIGLLVGWANELRALASFFKNLVHTWNKRL